MFEVGRLCIKLAGRDAGKKCVIVDVIDDRFVMIDGQTRRRKCNVLHLEPLSETFTMKKGASDADVKAAFKKLGIEIAGTKPKHAAQRPLPIRKGAEKQKANEEKQKKDALKSEKEKKTDKKALKTEASKKKAEKLEAKDDGKEAPEKKSKKAAPKKKTTTPTK
jgi:large subunit ribosomal protein L14e